MRIYSMTATFGKLENQTLTLQAGMNIIEAPNEWGKSTWCAFLVAMLYGIETRVHTTKTALADKERYAPWSGSPMSGKIELNWNGRDITIERRTKGRSIFGDFKAYETESGIGIAELTAANCGEMLLGVEKSVFTRAGFLKLTDLPVTQDETLRRRLNALVTTGDESGASDALAQKLKELKNRCRFNKTGLLPQAQAQKEELERKLYQMGQLRQQAERIRTRQEELEAYIQKLENHRTALEYAAAREYTQKAAAAQLQLETAAARAEQLQKACDQLPEPQELMHSLSRLQQLREQKEALHMEAQLQPPAPAAPDFAPPFRGCTAQQAAQQAQQDTRRYRALQNAVKKPSPILWICGLAAMAVGGILLGMRLPVPGVIALVLGLAGLAGGLLQQSAVKNKNISLQTNAQMLAQRYYPLEVSQWEEAAEQYAAVLYGYQQQLSQHREALAQLNTRMSTVTQQLNALTGGLPYLQCEQNWKSALERHKELADALREQRRAEDMAQALGTACKQVQPPAMPDELNFTQAETARLLADADHERQQLHGRAGQCRGQMEALGSEDALHQQLAAVEQRIGKLEDTYGALEIAQKFQQEAANELQRRFAPRISQRAQALFGRLTGSRYDRLVLGEDLALSAGAQGETTQRAALWRSDGTVDQLYLALRLAVAEELTPEAPLILDDALVRFDDTRLAAAMQILQQEARTKQVILFTCQGRELKHSAAENII